MPRNSLPNQYAADYEEQNRGILVELRRCIALWLVHLFSIPSGAREPYRLFCILTPHTCRIENYSNILQTLQTIGFPRLRSGFQKLFRHVIPSRPWRQQRNIHRLKLKPGLVGVRREVSLGGL